MVEGWELLVTDALNSVSPRPGFEELLLEMLSSTVFAATLRTPFVEEEGDHRLALGALAGALGLAGATWVAVQRRKNRAGAA